MDRIGPASDDDVVGAAMQHLEAVEDDIAHDRCRAGGSLCDGWFRNEGLKVGRAYLLKALVAAGDEFDVLEESCTESGVIKIGHDEGSFTVGRLLLRRTPACTVGRTPSRFLTYGVSEQRDEVVVIALGGAAR